MMLVSKERMVEGHFVVTGLVYPNDWLGFEYFLVQWMRAHDKVSGANQLTIKIALISHKWNILAKAFFYYKFIAGSLSDFKCVNSEWLYTNSYQLPYYRNILK